MSEPRTDAQAYRSIDNRITGPLPLGQPGLGAVGLGEGRHNLGVLRDEGGGDDVLLLSCVVGVVCVCIIYMCVLFWGGVMVGFVGGRCYDMAVVRLVVGLFLCPAHSWGEGGMEENGGSEFKFLLNY